MIFRIYKLQKAGFMFTWLEIRAKLSKNVGQFIVSNSCSSFWIIDPMEFFKSFKRSCNESKRVSRCFSSRCISMFYIILGKINSNKLIILNSIFFKRKEKRLLLTSDKLLLAVSASLSKIKTLISVPLENFICI